MLHALYLWLMSSYTVSQWPGSAMAHSVAKRMQGVKKTALLLIAVQAMILRRRIDLLLNVNKDIV